MTSVNSLAAVDISEQLAQPGASMFTSAPLTTVYVEITNTGPVAGSYVAILFVKPPNPGQNGAPLKSNRGFDRVFLQPGESTVVEFPVTAFDLTYADEAGQFVARPGMWTLSVDDAATTIVVA